MTDEFEDLLKGWLRERGASDRSAEESMAGHIAGLPPRRRRRRSPLAAAAAVVLAIGLAGFVLVQRQGPGTSRGPGPIPPDPAAFAGDARLAQCGAAVEAALAVFEMNHARDYHLHLPAMLLAPELDVDAPAFVVVYREMQTFPGGAPPPPGQTWPPRSLAPGHHDMCVLVGADPANLVRNIYSDVDITGLTAFVASPEPSTPGGLQSPSPSPSLDARSPSFTPEPAPSWTVDLAGQLDCEGRIANLGGEVPNGMSPEVFGPTAQEALDAFLGPSNPYASLPTAGFTPLQVEDHWASFGHRFAGRLKAVIVLSDQTEFEPGWTVMGLRACDASEFDPSVPLTFPVTIWTDRAGQPVSTDAVRSAPGPGHCGWDSAIFLNVGPATFFRDPKGVMRDWTTTRFDADARLPTRAVDSGYRSGDLSLWLDPGRDAYLVSPNRVERWPRSTDPYLGCM